jgi:phosphoglycerate kinase
VKSIADLGDLSGKRVLVRSDLNVPLDGARITDDGRIRASLPVIQELAAQGARVVVCAHLGRPKGEPDPRYSLAPVAHRLEELLGHQVMFSPDVVGDRADATVASLPEGGVALLENVRFVAAETSKDDAERGAFAAQLASLADAYVGDAFGAVHRKHASVYDVARLLPHAAGDLVRTEVEVLRRLTEHPERPYAVVLGGSKVSDKLAVIERLLTVADKILVGGGMVYTFLAAQGHEVGTSLLEADQIETVKGYLAEAEKRGVELILPSDIVVADRFAADAAAAVVPADAIPADRMGLDIGPASGATFAAALADSATIFWNGPMGVFEMPAFAAGTRAVAQALVDGTAFSVVGGGDSAAAVRTLGFDEAAFGHISTGGGASLEYLEGKTLPGLQALED